MLDIQKKIISTLIADSTLTALVPANNILTGPVDIVEEKIVNLTMPQINLWTVSEAIRTIPTNCRDTVIQLDIWSRDNQLNVENIYERVIVLLNYLSANQGSSHIFWQTLEGSSDQFESDRRIWHKTMRFQVWAQS